MKRIILLLLLTGCAVTLQAQKMSKSKQAILASVNSHQEALTAISDSIWALAETAFQTILA